MFAGVGPDAGTRLVFDLAQASYVSFIQYFGGWVDNGRPSINFTVSYSTDNGLTYTPLIDPTGGSYSTKDDPADIQIGGMNESGTTTFTQASGRFQTTCRPAMMRVATSETVPRSPM